MQKVTDSTHSWYILLVGHFLCPDASYTECGALGVYLCMGFTTTFDLVNGTASHFSFVHIKYPYEAMVLLNLMKDSEHYERPKIVIIETQPEGVLCASGTEPLKEDLGNWGW